MLANSLKVALKNLYRNSLYTALNIAGLAFGLTTDKPTLINRQTDKLTN